MVLDSTAEPLRLATTLPLRHFVLLDPAKIVADSSAAVPLLRRLHDLRPRAFLAYITGPSRTADIERVLQAAEAIAAREAAMAQALRAGKPIGEVMGADYEDMLQRAP